MRCGVEVGFIKRVLCFGFVRRIWLFSLRRDILRLSYGDI